MTYEEFLRNSLEEKNGGFEQFDTGDSDANWKEGWEEHNIYPNGKGGWNDDFGNPLAFPDGMPVYDYCLERKSESAQVIVMFFYDGDSGLLSIEWIRVFIFDYESVAKDVSDEEIGTIDAVDALLGTGLDAASKKAEELKKRKLVTVANLQKALEDYDERKGTAVEDGGPVEGKNKVFIDGSGRVYARRTELARQGDLDSEKSDRQSADNRLSAEIAKKADKEHTHKAADITDLPNYARSVNGEEPDADGDVEIDIDAVAEVAELPEETKKKVYLVPEVTTEKTVVDCSSVKSILSAAADYVSGVKGHSIDSLSKFFNFVKKSERAKNGDKSFPSHEGECFIIDIPEGITVNGKKSLHSNISCQWWKGKQGDVICEKNGNSVVATVQGGDNIRMFNASVGDVEMSELSALGVSGIQGFMGSQNSSRYIYSPLTLPTSMYFGEDSRTPPAVYAKSVELATKEALSEATSGADEKAAALGERIGAVESGVTTAKSDIAKMKSDISTAKTDITTMKSNITEAQADITTAQSDIAKAQSDIAKAQGDITKAQGDIEAVTSEVETVKTDVAALETKVVRSVNGTKPDENGNVEVAGSSDASDKNDTITVSDTDSAVSDDTGILSGESEENPKGLLRFAASKIWDYIRGKIRGVLGVDKVGDFIRLNYGVQCNESIENPGFKVDSFGNMATRNVRNGTLSFTAVKGRNVVSTDISEMYDSNYILIFEVTLGANLIERQISVQSKTKKSFSIIVYATEEDSLIKINYTALPIYPM